MVVGSAVAPAFSATAGVCPNEALRSELHSGQLPECRAYERVSPAYKESAILTSVFAISPDGSRFIGGSFGAFANTEQLTLSLTANVSGAAYLFSRMPTGWVAASLDPPASSYSSNGMLDASTDLSASLWQLETARKQGEHSTLVSDIYRELPLGTFAKVGPATPETSGPNSAKYEYRGASADLSRVLFSAIPGFRWLFDRTGEEGGTLYEYTGVEQPGEVQPGKTREPTLVGVEGGRGSTKLISQCGTRLGSSSSEERARENSGLPVRGSMYNAISASGNRVFFTAVGRDEAPGCEGEAPPVSELFAREELPLASGELPVGRMRTIPISEPSKEDCEACLTVEGLSDAIFQGASQDGSKVYFTTEQELLPGVRGINLFGYDFDNQDHLSKIALLSVPGKPGEPAEVQGVARVSEDGSHVYFVARGVLTSVPNGVDGSAIGGDNNLYVYERDERYPEGHTSFVATLAPGDSGDWARVDERPVMSSGDGRFLVFTSVADLTNEEVKGAKRQVFQYDALTGALVRASIGQDGYNDNGRGPAFGSTIVNAFPSAYHYPGADSPASASSVQAAADGAVFFESPDALAPGALNDQLDSLVQMVPNIYEYRSGHVYLLSDGHDVSVASSNPSTYLAGSDPSGGDVLFFTSDSLIPGDDNTQQDLYDARVEGGFPTLAPLAGCAGEACLGALAAAPTLAPLGGSATQMSEAEVQSVVPPPVNAKPRAKARKKTKVRKKPRGKTVGKAHRAAPRGNARDIHGLGRQGLAR
jgi:hypothetical protein